jgi:hypothetical protein
MSAVVVVVAVAALLTHDWLEPLGLSLLDSYSTVSKPEIDSP